MFHFQCRGLVLCAFFVQRIVGGQFCVQNLFSGLSASNFVYKICLADCRQAILCAKFVQRVVGKQFCVQNLFSGLSASNFVCKICSAGCREVISCAKFAYTLSPHLIIPALYILHVIQRRYYVIFIFITFRWGGTGLQKSSE